MIRLSKFAIASLFGTMLFTSFSYSEAQVIRNNRIRYSSHYVQRSPYSQPVVRFSPVNTFYPQQHGYTVRESVVSYPSFDYAPQTAILTQEELIEQIKQVCENAKKSISQPGEKQLDSLRWRILETLNVLQQNLAWSNNANLSNEAIESLKLSELSKSLVQRTEKLDMEPLTATFIALQDTSRQFDKVVFHPLQNQIRAYFVLYDAVHSESFETNFGEFCNSLPGSVEKYLAGDKPEYGSALAEGVRWMSDLSPYVPSAKIIADRFQGMLARPNFHVVASSRLLAAGFQQGVYENVDVNETIFGTTIRGSGHINGQTTAAFVHNNSLAELRIILDTNMNTNTVGVNGPVRIATASGGTMRSEKPIYITSDSIFTGTASTSAKLSSRTTGLSIDGGRLVKHIAQKRIQQQRPSSEAEARRRAENRMNSRFNSEVEPKIAELNQRYQQQLRHKLMEAGRFPRIWKLNTTSNELQFTVLVGDKSQPTQPFAPPTQPVGTDLSVRIHQSMPNNALETELGGRRIEEVKFIENLKNQFPELTKDLKRDEDQSPLAITFAKKSPVSFVFSKQTVSVIVHADQFEQDGQLHPGLDITFKFKVRVEKSQEGSVFVFEEAEPPAVFPPGFDPSGDRKISGREQMIRSIVTKRLEKSMKKSFELKAGELPDQWKGKGILSPEAISSENGWFTIAWNWN